MSILHLTAGSPEPARIEGQLRIYSMKHCPYAHKSRLVLKAKGLPHDVVNINLFNKPEWYSKLNPKGLVPTLLDGDKIVVESSVVCDYLDEKYPQNPLYPSDPELKKLDKELIEKIDTVSGVFCRCLWSKEEKTPEEWIIEFSAALKIFEDELAKRGTTFFGGDKPGMVDYMFWPWAERAPCVAFKLGCKLFKDGDFPVLHNWKKAMRQDPAVEATYNTPESFWKLAQAKSNGTEPKYDE